jgi:hypothetical protein
MEAAVIALNHGNLGRALSITGVLLSWSHESTGAKHDAQWDGNKWK